MKVVRIRFEGDMSFLVEEEVDEISIKRQVEELVESIVDNYEISTEADFDDSDYEVTVEVEEVDEEE